MEPLLAQTEELVARARDVVNPPSLRAALDRPGLQVIAEIKRRSPSAGDLGALVDPAKQAGRYVIGGAAAISVLTEPRFFGGSLDDLESVARTVEIPVLRKDFILHESQIAEAKIAGAAAVLLIVAAMDAARLEELLGWGTDLGLDCLVEAHSDAEVDVANGVGATLIGVNNRDLTTFVTDLGVAERAAPLVAAEVKVAESGVSDPAGAARMAAAGYDAILVGEALVRSEDPAALLASLRQAGAR